MNLADVKARLQQDVAAKKDYFKNSTYQEQLSQSRDVFDEGVQQYTGILRAGSAPTTEQKKARNPITDTPNDSLLTRTVKSLYNEVAPTSLQVGINYGGMTHYNTDNKEFNQQDPNVLASSFRDIPDDPNGAGTVYYLKVREGYDRQGNSNWVYKAGTSDDSAFMRYLEQTPTANYQVLASKRTNAYKDIEAQIHGNQAFMQDRALAERSGQHIIGSGDSELYNRDILGLDTQSQEQLNANKLADYRKAVQNQQLPKTTGLANWGASVGSGALNLIGKGVKAVGELESTSTDNNFLTRSGQNLQNKADKLAGYNRKDQNLGGYMMQSGATKVVNGDLTGLGDMINGIVTGGPEAFLNSLPEMVAQTAGGLTPVGIAAKSSVLLANTNDQLDNRLKNMGVRKDATWDEKAGVLASQAIVQAMDTQAFRFVTNGAKVAILGEKTGKAIPLETFLQGKSPTFIGAFAKGLKLAAGGTAGVAVEGAQEAAQEAINILQEQYGSDKYKDQSIGKILADDKNLQRIATAASQGAIAGGSVSMTASGLGGVKLTAQEIAKVNQENARREQSVTGSQGEAQLNADMFGTVAEDASANYRALGDIQTQVNTILSDKQISPAEQIDALNSTTQPSTPINSQVQAVKASLTDKMFTMLSPNEVEQLGGTISSNPEIADIYNQVVAQISEQADPTKVTQEQIQQDALRNTLQSLSLKNVTDVLSTISPKMVDKVMSTFNASTANKQLSDILVQQQNLTGEQAGQATRQAAYSTQQAPTIDSVEQGIGNVSAKSSRGVKRAQMNVQQVLSQMSTDALSEALNKTSNFAEATKKTRSLIQTLKGEAKAGFVLEPKQIESMINTELSKRESAKASTANILHDKGRSIQSSRAMQELSKQVGLIQRAKGISTEASNQSILLNQRIKTAQSNISKFIKESVNSTETAQEVNNIINELEAKGQVVHPNIISNLRKQLASKIQATPAVKITKTLEDVIASVETVKEIGETIVSGLVDKSALATRKGVAGVLRTNIFYNLGEVEMVRKAIDKLKSSNEITDSLAEAMYKRLNTIEALTKHQVDNNIALQEIQAESIKASENITVLYDALSEYYPEISKQDVAGLIKDASDDVFDKMVKMICGN